jgi:hypothetical protein
MRWNSRPVRRPPSSSRPAGTSWRWRLTVRVADEAWRAARDGRVDRRRIQPTIVLVDGRPMVQHPYEDVPSPI